MSPPTKSKERAVSESSSNTPNIDPNTATSLGSRPKTRRTGPPAPIEEHQEVKDSLEGRKFLEKLSLLCPPGEPQSHTSLSTCLHQISAIAGLQRQHINAIRAVAFLLEDMEDIQINESIRLALDSQMTEFTYDMKTLIEDAKEKINNHVKISEERINSLPPPQPTQPTHLGTTYASALVNAPAHANPRVAAREGIKARQFLVDGMKDSKFSHLDTIQLKAKLNILISELGLQKGKIRSVTNSRNGSTLIEADTDATATWLSNVDNQRKLCILLGENTEFRNRLYHTIALNVPIALNPDEAKHCVEIHEANDLEPQTVTQARWAKAIDRRSPDQRTAHLLLTFISADAANRAIVNGLTICNRRCRVERTKREPIRCLKCQGWNHYAKDCLEEDDKCANCAGPHRTRSCMSSDKKCVSCKSNDHTSWSRKCPTFLRKSDEFDSRNPDNSLQFYPTAESWTWTATDRPTRVSGPAVQQHPSATQLGKRPQQNQQTRKPNNNSGLHRQNNNDWETAEGPGEPSTTIPSVQRPEDGNGGTTSTQNPNRPPNPSAPHINV